jgi:crotonobetainyl-CoA:carnitine CoA-transferase CaiB-like acyl-CoA transferase
MGGGYPRDERTWQALLAWMDETGAAAGLEDRSYRRRSPDERNQFLALLHRFVAAMPSEQAYRGGQARHLPWGLVRRPEENLDDPHWHDRGFFQEVELPGLASPVRVPGAPYRFSSTPLAPSQRAPLLGEHNHEVYAGELGLTTQQLLALAQAGVI